MLITTNELLKKIIFIVNEDTLDKGIYAPLLRLEKYSVSVLGSVNDAKPYLNDWLNIDLLIIDTKLAASDSMKSLSSLNELNIPVLYIGTTADILDISGHLTLLDDVMIRPLELSSLVATIDFHLAFATQVKRIQTNIANLEWQLTSECLIGVAVGITMQRNKITKACALDLLIHKANFKRNQLEDLSMEVLETAELSYTTTRNSK